MTIDRNDPLQLSSYLARPLRTEREAAAAVARTRAIMLGVPMPEARSQSAIRRARLEGVERYTDWHGDAVPAESRAMVRYRRRRLIRKVKGVGEAALFTALVLALWTACAALGVTYGHYAAVPVLVH